jgi:uncharacterized OB-fold protein
MTMTTTPVAPAKPAPVPDEHSAPFFDGARDGLLMLRRCRACATYMSPVAGIGAPVRPRCVACFSGDLEWAPSGGRASLYSFVIMHQRYDPAFAQDIPYNIVVVVTEEGVRLTSQVVGCPNDALAIGMALEVVFERMGDGVAVPKFRPQEMDR